MRTETTRPRRHRKPVRKPRAKKPEPAAVQEDETTPLADELVVQGDRGYDDAWTRVEPDPETTPW